MRRPHAAAPLLALATLSACQAETLSQSYQIDRTRILGVKAEPAEPAPGDSVIFSSLVVHPEFEIESVTWLGCLALEADSFGCDLSAFTDLSEEELEDLSTEQLEEILAGVEYFGAEPDFLPPYTPSADLLEGLTEEQANEGVNLLLTLTAVAAVEGRDFDESVDLEVAYKRVPISLAVTPNRNPDIVGLNIDGQPVAGGGVITLSREQTYAIEPVLSDDSIQEYTYIDEDGAEELRVEEPYFTFYMTHGAPEFGNFSLYPYSAFSYIADPGDEAGEGVIEATLWAVVRDRRGGMDWWTQRIDIQ